MGEESEQRRVRVLDMSGSAKEVDVSPLGRVSALMEGVEKAFGVSSSRQRLICGGRIMKAEDPLSSYKLGNNSTVHLCPRSTTAPPPPRSPEVSPPPPLSRRTFFEDDLEQQQPEMITLADFSEPGTTREFVWGFVMGFVLGFIMLLYLWERSVSHRQKMGILSGATAQLFVKYVHSAAQAAQAAGAAQARSTAGFAP